MGPKMFVILRNNSVCRWVLLQPQIYIILKLIIQSISSFLAVMVCGGYVSCIHKHCFTRFCWFEFTLLFWDEHGVLVMCQVFGPSDAVDFVQKLLNVRACYIFFYLATRTKKNTIVKNQNWIMRGRKEKNESIIAEWNLNRKRRQIFQGFPFLQSVTVWALFTIELATCIIHKAKKLQGHTLLSLILRLNLCLLPTTNQLIVLTIDTLL